MASFSERSASDKGAKQQRSRRRLCITQQYLRAIEQDDLKVLPGSFFYKSFVRQYAKILGIDEQTLKPGVEALTADLEPPLPGAGSRNATLAASPQNPPIRDLDPLVRDGNRRYFPDARIGMPLTGLIAVVLACSGFYAWWNEPERAVASEPPVAAAVTPAVTPVTEPAQVRAAAPVNAPVAATPANPSDLNHVVLSLSATETTWLSITSDGKQIFSGVLEPSETKTLTAPEAAKMKVGNAGGLDVLWNGKPIGPIGPRGQVRVVLFTPENFQILGPSQAL